MCLTKSKVKGLAVTKSESIPSVSSNEICEEAMIISESYDNFQPSLLITGTSMTAEVHCDESELNSPHPNEGLTKDDTEIADHPSPTIPALPSEASQRSRSRRSRRKNLEPAVVFDPFRLPQRSSMKRDSSPSLSSSFDSSSLSTESSTIRKYNSSIKMFLPGHSEPVERPRTISFDNEVSVRQISSALSLTKNNDRNLLWYQGDEQANIKHNIQKLISRVDARGFSQNGRKYCLRGLERFFRADECRFNRQTAEEIVFREQYSLRESLQQDLEEDTFAYNPIAEHIANAYSESTRSSQVHASRKGLEDACAAERILGTCFRRSGKTNEAIHKIPGDRTNRGKRQQLEGHSFHEPRSSGSNVSKRFVHRRKSM